MVWLPYRLLCFISWLHTLYTMAYSDGNAAHKGRFYSSIPVSYCVLFLTIVQRMWNIVLIYTEQKRKFTLILISNISANKYPM